MAAQYKTIHPVKYYREYLELTAPAATEPGAGWLVPNVELPALCSPELRPGPPGDRAQAASHFLAELVRNCGCVDPRRLCVAPGRLAWVLYCDVVCLDLDGSLLDACTAALLAALRTVTLPRVQYDGDSEETSVLLDQRESLDVLAHPAATTYAVFDDDTLIADPTAEEESLCSGLLTVVVEGGQLCSVHKPGGSPLTHEQLQRCIALAHRRGRAVHNLVRAALCSPER
ncbi:exosome complex component RRP43-like isoform X2 [Bacillus rossius redtenbacheri]|uniref:exosome complex component RRP43-like isoform X2 n=1 Tax=Bacillus rossius redtenbacheri TaxID=93214 RepID=UPI002FDE14B3